MDVFDIERLKWKDIIIWSGENPCRLEVDIVWKGYTYIGGTRININSITVINKTTNKRELISSDELVNIHFKKL